ncbi:protein LTV1 homolog, partial [Lates japonicus]
MPSRRFDTDRPGKLLMSVHGSASLLLIRLQPYRKKKSLIEKKKAATFTPVYRSFGRDPLAADEKAPAARPPASHQGPRLEADHIAFGRGLHHILHFDNILDDDHHQSKQAVEQTL